MRAFDETQHDVPDSTDWIETPLASLMQVEQAFRCHVCKDFYNSPMLASCSHTFCSLCIRRSLAHDGKCPLCRASDQESKLRANLALREAVDAFVKSRPTILKFAKAPPTASPKADLKSPKRKAIDLTQTDAGEEPSNKRQRMSTRSSKTKAVEATAAILKEEQDVPAPIGEDTQDFEPDDGLVACPICSARMKPQQVDRHLDESCPDFARPGNPSKPTRTSATPGRVASPQSFSTAAAAGAPKSADRLPGLAYNMLRDAALRKKLGELRLPTHGSRSDWERRHREWVIMWNANCDSNQPKSRSELLRDLDVWERTAGSRALANSGPGSLIKDKDFDRDSWSANHNSSFQDLIANARRTRAQAHPRSKENTRSGETPADVRGPSSESEAAEPRKSDPPQLLKPDLRNEHSSEKPKEVEVLKTRTNEAGLQGAAAQASVPLLKSNHWEINNPVPQMSNGFHRDPRV